MSLEDSIDKLIHALDRNTNTLLKAGASGALSPNETADVPKPTKTPPILKDLAKPVPPAAKAPGTPSEKIKEAAKTEKKAAKAGELTYDQVSKATLKLHGEKGRAIVIGILAEFGAKAAKELKPEQYADYMARLIEESEDGDVA